MRGFLSALVIDLLLSYLENTNRWKWFWFHICIPSKTDGPFVWLSRLAKNAEKSVIWKSDYETLYEFFQPLLKLVLDNISSKGDGEAHDLSIRPSWSDFYFQNIALLFPPQERILVNRFGSRGLSKFVLETWIRKCIDREGLGRRANLYPFIECFHMTSRRPYWCPKTMKRRPCWCPKPILWELNSFLMQTRSFVPINLHICWPREWKHSIQPGGANVIWVHY